MGKFSAEQIIKIIIERPEGVSVKDYCAQVGMHPRVFYYHRSRLVSRQNDGEQIKGDRAKVSKGASAGFIPLKIKNRANETPLAVVELPGKMSISIYDAAILPLLYPLLG